MKTTRLIVIGLASATVLAIELVWTRIFSAEFFYSFAFLTLSLAIMGLGLGALCVRLFPALDRPATTGLALSLAALAAIAGPPLVFRLGLDFSLVFSHWSMIGKFVLTILLLSSSFFFAGVFLALYFRRYHDEMPRLYMSDLVGAGGGVLFAVVVMNQFGTPGSVLLSCVPILAAALIESRRWAKTLPLVLVVVLGLVYPSAERILEADREERAPVIYKHWDAIAKLKAYDFGGYYRGINIDNVANTPVIPFDGDWDALRALLGESGWNIDVGYLVDKFDGCRFLSLGSGGGSDVLQALEEGATEIHAVEVNPHINRMMIKGDPSGYVVHDSSVVDSTGRLVTMDEYSGHIYDDPRVKVISEDARTYVRRHENSFDVIYSLSSNTWAAFGSGAFALAENYLFTTEAFEDYWTALSDSGFLSMEHQVYMPRLVSEVLAALDDLGVEHPEDHIAVYDLPKLHRNLLLLSKRPMTDDLRRSAYGALTPEKYEAIHLLYPAADSLADNIINQIATRGWRAVADSSRIDVSPCSDNRPFVAQMGLWRNLDRKSLEKVNKWDEFYSGFPLSKLIVVVILIVVFVVTVPLNLLPFFVHRGLRAVPWLYFFVIGAAFMGVEAVLIQRYALFIGASIYSIATVLLTLLVAAGIGSRVSDHVSDRVAFLGIAGWLVLELLVRGVLTDALVGLSMPGRAVVSAALVFPVGFFMGMPFPKAARRVGEAIDWGFAVGGASSVLGGTAVVLVAFTHGFAIALLSAAVLYLFSWFLLSLRSLW